MASMGLLLQSPAGVRLVHVTDLFVWFRDAVRLAVTARNDETGRSKAIRLPPLSEAWLRQLEEESSRHPGDS